MCRNNSMYEDRLGPEASGLVPVLATDGMVISELAKETRLPVELLLREEERERETDRDRDRDRE